MFALTSTKKKVEEAGLDPTDDDGAFVCPDKTINFRKKGSWKSQRIPRKKAFGVCCSRRERERIYIRARQGSMSVSEGWMQEFGWVEHTQSHAHAHTSSQFGGKATSCGGRAAKSAGKKISRFRESDLLVKTRVARFIGSSYFLGNDTQSSPNILLHSSFS